MAAGEPMYGRNSATTRGNWPLAACSVIFSVSGSTTSYFSVLTRETADDALAGSAWRSQLNFTAWASNTVPSVNFTFGRIFIVHTMASLVVTEEASSGSTAPLVGSANTRASYTANSR